MTEVRDKEFSVILISSTSSHLYDNNSAKFTNQLPSELIFDRRYTVSVQAIYYPRNRAPHRSRRSIVENTGSLSDVLVDQTGSLQLPPIIDENRGSLRSDNLKLPPQLIVHGDSSLEPDGTDDGRARVHISWPDEETPEIDEAVSPSEIPETSPAGVGAGASKRTADLPVEEVPRVATPDEGNTSLSEESRYINTEMSDVLAPRFMCVYCDIVKPYIVGDQRLDLLAIIPLSNTASYDVREAMKHTLVGDRISQISVRITDEYGRRIVGEGETVIVLSFSVIQ